MLSQLCFLHYLAFPQHKLEGLVAHAGVIYSFALVPLRVPSPVNYAGVARPRSGAVPLFEIQVAQPGRGGDEVVG